MLGWARALVPEPELVRAQALERAWEQGQVQVPVWVPVWVPVPVLAWGLALAWGPVRCTSPHGRGGEGHRRNRG